MEENLWSIRYGLFFVPVWVYYEYLFFIYRCPRALQKLSYGGRSPISESRISQSSSYIRRCSSWRTRASSCDIYWLLLILLLGYSTYSISMVYSYLKWLLFSGRCTSILHIVLHLSYSLDSWSSFLGLFLISCFEHTVIHSDPTKISSSISHSDYESGWSAMDLCYSQYSI